MQGAIFIDLHVNRERKMNYTIKDILRMEVTPALGCTEPSAVALCAASAASLLPDKNIISIEVWLDPNIYKNAMGVAIPVAGGIYGIDMAAMLGAFCGDPLLGLEVFRDMDDESVARAEKFICDHEVKICLLENIKRIFIKTKLISGADIAEAQIEDSHDNITALRFNGKQIETHRILSGTRETYDTVQQMEAWLIKLSLDEIVSLIDELDSDDFEFIREGIRYNTALSEYGLKNGSGLGIGLTFERLVSEGLLKKDMILAARILTSAASDARMSGASMPAMSSAGSGNHGLTAVLPILAVNKYIARSDETRVLKAIALSHVLTAYIKVHTGRLSAVCGCSIAAGAGAAGGITYLMNGTLHHIAGAIKNLIEDLAGVICDGAKAGCSLKLATAAGTAVQSALFALHGIDVKSTDGIIASTPEQTMKNIGELSTCGMIETDRTILRIMIRKQFEKFKSAGARS